MLLLRFHWVETWTTSLTTDSKAAYSQQTHTYSGEEKTGVAVRVKEKLFLKVETKKKQKKKEGSTDGGEKEMAKTKTSLPCPVFYTDSIDCVSASGPFFLFLFAFSVLCGTF